MDSFRLKKKYLASRPNGAPFVYLYDEYPDANGLFFDYFKLNSAYAGACIRVRRSSDNLEADIPFLGNYIDKAAITSFVGAGNGFITKKYNQNGGGNDWFETVAASQPQIVVSGTLNEDGNGFVYESATGQRLRTSSITGTDSSVFQVFENSKTLSVMFAYSTVKWIGILQSGSTAASHNNPVIPQYYNNGVLLNPNINRGDLYTAYTGGIKLASSHKIDFTGWIGYWSHYSASIPSVDNRYADIVYSTNKEADRVAIEAIINGNYNIY